MVEDIQFEFVDNFDTLCYFLLITSTLLAISGTYFKIQAYKHHQALSLQILQYLDYAFVFVVDVAFFGTNYSLISLLAIIVVITASIV